MKMWPYVARLYWDPWYNVPVIKPKQEEIDLLYQIRLIEPGDARPAFPGDHEKLKKAIINEFGNDAFYRKYLEGRFILLNKIPHWDVMYEVISSGNVIGQLYYDPYKSAWRFRLTHQGAYLAIHDNLVDYIKINPPFYVEREVRMTLSTSSRQVVIQDEKGNIRGLGEVMGDHILITKVFHDRTHPVETSNKATTLDDVIKYNKEGIEILEEKSIRFLRRLSKKYSNLHFVVSYSGGKDSLVSLDLTHKAIGRLDIVFNDTGIEMPETLKNVELIAEKYGYKLYTASAGDIFWKAIDVFGPPAKDYRWCCKIIKLLPIAKLTKALYPNGALNIVGQRAFESLDRAKSSLVWRNKWIPHMVSTTPIQYWSQLSCWLYIYKYQLPYNKLYEEGFDRLGCYLCPSCALAEFEDTKKLYPDLWIRWENALEIWRKKLNQPEEWIKYGLWRWLTPSTAKKRITHHLSKYISDWNSEYTNRLRYNRIGLSPVRSILNNIVSIEFNSEILPSIYKDVFIENISKLGFKTNSENPLTIDKESTRIEINGNTIKAEFTKEGNFEVLTDILKIVYRLRGCVYCGSCVLWTRKGFIYLTQKGPKPIDQLDSSQYGIYIQV
ncbi:MAG: phosphoadenosine phosphosulfate reductase family protein [Desulfurococcaceae archaeon]